MPGHTGGWLALKDAGLQFCGSFPAHEERPQLYHDPVRPPALSPLPASAVATRRKLSVNAHAWPLPERPLQAVAS